MISLGVGGFLIIRHFGAALTAPAASPMEAFGSGVAKLKLDTLMHLFLALAVIITTARGLGAVFSRFGQPPVIGEVIAGLLIGPSLLGRLAPALSSYILPPPVAPLLGVLAQVGVVLYMFLVGTELDLSRLRGRVHSTVAISHASIIVRFCSAPPSSSSSNIGLDLKVISPTLFAMLVLMAVVTTVSTTPILQALAKVSATVVPVAR
jgi:Kef-type K+ transport system membrane component KefB